MPTQFSGEWPGLGGVGMPWLGTFKGLAVCVIPAWSHRPPQFLGSRLDPGWGLEGVSVEGAGAVFQSAAPLHPCGSALCTAFDDHRMWTDTESPKSTSEDNASSPSVPLGSGPRGSSASCPRGCGAPSPLLAPAPLSPLVVDCEPHGESGAGAAGGFCSQTSKCEGSGGGEGTPLGWGSWWRPAPCGSSSSAPPLAGQRDQKCTEQGPR